MGTSALGGGTTIDASCAAPACSVKAPPQRAHVCTSRDGADGASQRGQVNGDGPNALTTTPPEPVGVIIERHQTRPSRPRSRARPGRLGGHVRA